MDGADVQDEGDKAHERSEAEQVETLAASPIECHWPDDVELLLYAKRPQVKKWLGIGSFVKVSAFTQEIEVGHEARAADDVPAELLVFVSQQDEPAADEAYREHKYQYWKDTADASAIEIQEAEAAMLQVAEYDARYQEPGNNKKYVDANESSAQRRRKCVKNDDAENGDRA